MTKYFIDKYYYDLFETIINKAKFNDLIYRLEKKNYDIVASICFSTFSPFLLASL